MSGFEQPSETVASQWANLQREWENCRAEWNDAVAQRFESEFWSQWEAAVPGAINLLRDLEEAVADADRVLREE